MNQVKSTLCGGWWMDLLDNIEEAPVKVAFEVKPE